MRFDEALKIINEEYSMTSFDGFEIFVGTDEGKYIPHFHLKKRIGKINYQICIRIDIPAYFKHGIKDTEFNSLTKKHFLIWINSKPSINLRKNADGTLPKNNWENIRNIWNENFTDNKITCNQPNYKLLGSF